MKARHFTKVAEELEFNVSEPSKERGGEWTIEFGQESSAGEDWWEVLRFKRACDIKDALWERIENWDSDEEAEIYINLRGTRGVPSSIRTLLDDQDWKLEQLKKLYEAL